MILSNQVVCTHCGDKPYSAHRHDMKACSCGGVFVDGGMDYLRRGGNGNCVDMSIVIPNRHVLGLQEAIEDPSKNSLGKLCNVARYLRDQMGINISYQEEENDIDKEM